MNIERLKELKTNLMFEKAVSDEATRFDRDSETNRTVHQNCNDLISLIDAEIARHSVKSEDVQSAIGQLQSEYVDDFEGYPASCGKWNRNIDLAITALQEYQPWVEGEATDHINRCPNCGWRWRERYETEQMR